MICSICLKLLDNKKTIYYNILSNIKQKIFFLTFILCHDIIRIQIGLYIIRSMFFILLIAKFEEGFFDR
jgi:hypothetical protein